MFYTRNFRRYEKQPFWFIKTSLHPLKPSATIDSLMIMANSFDHSITSRSAQQPSVSWSAVSVSLAAVHRSRSWSRLHCGEVVCAFCACVYLHLRMCVVHFRFDLCEWTLDRRQSDFLLEFDSREFRKCISFYVLLVRMGFYFREYRYGWTGLCYVKVCGMLLNAKDVLFCFHQVQDTMKKWAFKKCYIIKI